MGESGPSPLRDSTAVGTSSASGGPPSPARDPKSFVLIGGILVAVIILVATFAGGFGGGSSSPSVAPHTPPPSNGTSNGTTPPPGSQGSLGLNLELGHLYVGPGTGGTLSSQGCTSNDYCFLVPIVGSFNNVTPADFSMSVWNISDQAATYMGTVGFAILNHSGGVVVSSAEPVESQWVNGVGSPATPLMAGMFFTVDMGTANPGEWQWALALTGEGAYSAAGTFSIGL